MSISPLLARGRDRLETCSSWLCRCLVIVPLLARGRDRLETILVVFRLCLVMISPTR